MGKKLRAVERDTQEWKAKFEDSNDQVKKMNAYSMEREKELASVKKKLTAMEKLNRTLISSEEQKKEEEEEEEKGEKEKPKKK